MMFSISPAKIRKTDELVFLKLKILYLANTVSPQISMLILGEVLPKFLKFGFKVTSKMVLVIPGNMNALHLI